VDQLESNPILLNDKPGGVAESSGKKKKIKWLRFIDLTSLARI